MEGPEPAQHFCESCGAKLHADAKFCGSCGHVVPADTAEDQSPPSTVDVPPSAPAAPPPAPPEPGPPPVPPPAPTAAKPASSGAAPPSRGLLIGLGALAGLLFVAGILSFALGGSGDDSAKVDRLERREARLEDSLESSRSATSTADDITTALLGAEAAFLAADYDADTVFDELVDTVNAAIDRSNAGEPGATAFSEVDPVLQRLIDQVANDQAALDELHQELAIAQELLG